MISDKIRNNLKGSSLIRAMFEEGTRLKKIYGEDNVYDFSIGNPEIEPPEQFKDKMTQLINTSEKGTHRYMSNAGYDDVRKRIADYVNKEKNSDLSKDNIVMTCGAAGGLNVVLKTILNPGDEVIVFSPYFVEYLFYIDNYLGKSVTVKTSYPDFTPDPDEFALSITSRTKAVIINSPNNPTGIIYSDGFLRSMADIIDKKQDELGINILVIADEPYDKIVYNNAVVPSIFNIFPNSVIVNSFSKSHALPGQRIGYIAANPKIYEIDLFMNALIFSNRILGFVNAPALFQQAVSQTLDTIVDMKIYQERMELLYDHLTNLGFEAVKPSGAFYIFPKSPMENEKDFVKKAAKYNILVVPGSGFGCPGYFRLAFCVDMKIIKNSLPAFTKLAQELNLK